MITIKQSRVRGSEQPHISTPIKESDPLEAALHLIEVDLSWGVEIKELSETRIVTETRIMDCVDTTVYSGPKTQMNQLVILTCLYGIASAEHHDLITERASEAFCEMDERYRTPQMLDFMSPQLLGGHHLQIAVMLACGITEKEDITAGSGMKMEDLIAALQLQRDDGLPFRDALNL